MSIHLRIQLTFSKQNQNVIVACVLHSYLHLSYYSEYHVSLTQTRSLFCAPRSVSSELSKDTQSSVISSLEKIMAAAEKDHPLSTGGGTGVGVATTESTDERSNVVKSEFTLTLAQSMITSLSSLISPDLGQAVQLVTPSDATTGDAKNVADAKAKADASVTNAGGTSRGTAGGGTGISGNPEPTVSVVQETRQNSDFVSRSVQVGGKRDEWLNLSYKLQCIMYILPYSSMHVVCCINMSCRMTF